MSEAKRRVLMKLGEQKLRELQQKIEECSAMLIVVRSQFEQIKKQLPRKTKHST